MTRDRAPLPTWADWQDSAESLGLSNRSGELSGPCPSCGGTDRFHVRRARDGHGAAVGCRGCIDGGGDGFGGVLRVAFGERDRGVEGPERPVEAIPARTGESPAPVPSVEPRVRCARSLWDSAGAADDSPGRAYLARRWAWPPVGTPDPASSGEGGTGAGVPNAMNATQLPASVRWLDATAAPKPDRAAKWYGLLAGAAGALTFAWRTPDALAAVSLIAVSDAGERVRWFPRRDRLGAKVMTLGARSGAVFEARPAPAPDAPVHVCEGEVDALALTLAPWTGPGRVVALGGTSGMKRAAELPGTGPVVLHCDGDRGGEAAVRSARDAIEAAGRECSIAWRRDGDPAGELAEWLAERAAIREFDGGATRADADRGAWTDLFNAREESRNA